MLQPCETAFGLNISVYYNMQLYDEIACMNASSVIEMLDHINTYNYEIYKNLLKISKIILSYL